ncbi:hypothetical protein [Geothrix fuzhouensis]|uniref:hypothetical protein n=1 Tax=Geothrix fuzhouensis TaxID=2966451 RepID=UPI0021479D65|nr:hypothetical protein [Geothrix fuzhouensis]
MPIALEITLILVLIALAAGLVPLLFQLRRTAQGVDTFLLTSSKELSQIAEDVHAFRMHMDSLAGSLQTSLGELSTFTRSIAEIGRTVTELNCRVRDSLESTYRNIGKIIRGIGAVLAFFKIRQTPHESE